MPRTISSLSVASLQKLNGGTTVSGTMVVANMAGIQIFVTGGIGGVHHGVQESKYIKKSNVVYLACSVLKFDLQVLCHSCL